MYYLCIYVCCLYMHIDVIYRFRSTIFRYLCSKWAALHMKLTLEQSG